MNPLRAILEKPWKHSAQTVTGAPHDIDRLTAVPPQRIALFFFLGVVTVLFGLFIWAYFIRMELDDWRPMPESQLLWINTAVLFLSSLSLQWTLHLLKKGLDTPFRFGLLLSAFLTLGFVFGQLSVWQIMSGQGYLLNNNPANSFFYLLTGVHALHILGGLWVWTKTCFRVLAGAGPDEVRLSVELCALYWHFLLLVWLVLFGLLSYT